MARMSIDDMVCRDPRITRLAKLIGCNRYEALGRLLCDVWPIAYDRMCAVIPSADIDATLEGLSAALLECGLAHRADDGLRLAGASERVEYLVRAKHAGARGGKQSAITRASQKPLKGSGSEPLGLRNLPDPVPDVVPDPVLVPDPVVSKRESVRARKPKPSALTATERYESGLVLSRLTARTGVDYKSERHTALVVARLREGYSSLDLRAVIAYCAEERGWQADEKMRLYLRPPTLFGPQKLQEYIDEARTWAARHYPEEFRSNT